MRRKRHLISGLTLAALLVISAAAHASGWGVSIGFGHRASGYGYYPYGYFCSDACMPYGYVPFGYRYSVPLGYGYVPFGYGVRNPLFFAPPVSNFVLLNRGYFPYRHFGRFDFPGMGRPFTDGRHFGSFPVRGLHAVPGPGYVPRRYHRR